MEAAPLCPPGQAAGAAGSGPPLTAPFSFQVLGAVILGFGVWILVDRSSFISVLRKDPSAPPAPAASERGPGQQAGLLPRVLEPQHRSLFQLPSGPCLGPAC